MNGRGMKRKREFIRTVRGNIKIGEGKREILGGRGDSKAMPHIALTSAPPMPKKYSKKARGKEIAIDINVVASGFSMIRRARPMIPIKIHNLLLASLYFKSL